MNKFFIKYSFLLILVVLFMSQTVVLAKYEDVKGHWAEDTINDFVEKGYLSSEEEYFYPDNSVTHGELASVMNRYFSYGITENDEENLELARENGYLMSDDSSQSITREEVAVLICKALSLAPVEEESTFLDAVDISSWAKGYVVALEKQEIMIGYPNQKYLPSKNITKAEFVTVLNRTVGVGGSDLDIIETEDGALSIGVLEMENGEIRFCPIEEELSLKEGDVVVLALRLPTEEMEEQIAFFIGTDDVVEFEQETYQLKALNCGTTEFQVSLEDEKISFQITVE